MKPLIALLMSCFFIALLQNTVLISYAQAHEMDGIEHVHLSNGIVQMIEPIPGVMPAPDAKITKPESGVVPKSSQPGGLVSLVIQVVLIFSVIVLLVVVLRANTKQRTHQHTSMAKHPTPPPSPLPPS